MAPSAAAQARGDWGLQEAQIAVRDETILREVNRVKERHHIASGADGDYQPLTQLTSDLASGVFLLGDPTSEDRPRSIRQSFEDYYPLLLFQLVASNKVVVIQEALMPVMGAKVLASLETLKTLHQEHKNRSVLIPPSAEERTRLAAVEKLPYDNPGQLSLETAANRVLQVPISDLDAVVARAFNLVIEAVRSDLEREYESRSLSFSTTRLTEQVTTMRLNQDPGGSGGADNTRHKEDRYKGLSNVPRFDKGPSQSLDTAEALLRSLIQMNISFEAHKTQKNAQKLEVDYQVRQWQVTLDGEAMMYFRASDMESKISAWLEDALRQGWSFKEHFIPWVVQNTAYFDPETGDKLFYRFKDLRIRRAGEALQFIHDAQNIRSYQEILHPDQVQVAITDAHIVSDFMGQLRNHPHWTAEWVRWRAHRKLNQLPPRVTLEELERWVRDTQNTVIRQEQPVGAAGGQLHALQERDVRRSTTNSTSANDTAREARLYALPEAEEEEHAGESAGETLGEGEEDLLNAIGAFNSDQQHPNRQRQRPRRPSVHHPCSICGAPTHWRADCPRKAEAVAPQRRGQGGQRSRFGTARWSVRIGQPGQVATSRQVFQTAGGQPFDAAAALQYAQSLPAAEAAMATIEYAAGPTAPSQPVFLEMGLPAFWEPRC